MKTIGKAYNSEGIVPLRIEADQVRTTREAQTAPGGRFSPEVQAKARAADGVAKVAALIAGWLGEPVTVKFDKHAGCGMCPCSPGFRLMIEGTTDLGRALIHDRQFAGRHDAEDAAFCAYLTNGELQRLDVPRTWFAQLAERGTAAMVEQDALLAGAEAV